MFKDLIYLINSKVFLNIEKSKFKNNNYLKEVHLNDNKIIRLPYQAKIDIDFIVTSQIVIN